MKIKCLIPILLVLAFYAYADKDTQSLILNKGVKNLDFLSNPEKEVIIELNSARTNPAKFAEYIIDFKRFYLGKNIQIAREDPIITKEGVTAVNEAIDFLKSIEPLKPLRVSKGLSLAAKSHAKDQSSKGTTGHQGSDKSSPMERMNRYGEWEKAAAENLSYGTRNPRHIVIYLIIDDGVKNRGHRKNIFNADLKVVGVSIDVHSRFDTMCVMDFAASYIEKNIRR